MDNVNHGIARAEWERRFAARIAEKARGQDDEVLSDEDLKEITTAEIESWPEGGDSHNGTDWMRNTPEEAADEQMSNWEPDE